MLTVKTICAILLGTSLGVTGTVTVQKARPAAAVIKSPSKKLIQRPQLNKAKAAPFISARSNIQIMDCPAHGSPFAAEPVQPYSLPSDPIGGGDAPRLLPPVGPVWGGGGGIAPSSPPTVSPGVPDVATWAQFLAGFGLVAISLRKREGRETV